MPKAAITRMSSLDIDPNYNPNNMFQGFYVPKLTTIEINAITPPTLQYGGLVYNTDTDMLQLYQTGVWNDIETAGDGDLIAPSVANTAALPAVPVNGMIVYQTDIGLFKIYQAPPGGAGWSILYANVSAATGVGLVAGNSPYSLPSGTSAAVEVANNQVAGFAYYNTTASNVRAWLNGAWTTIETSTNAASRAGLTAGNTSVVLPSGALAAVETPGTNNVEGFAYYNTTGANVRAYINAAWTTIETSTNAATGAGLTAGNTPLVLPSGPQGTVEVAGNEIEGFAYYNTTGSNLRIYNNGAWTTIITLIGGASGAGLREGDEPVILPTGELVNVETPGTNNVEGFMYVNTDGLPETLGIRVYINNGGAGEGWFTLALM